MREQEIRFLCNNEFEFNMWKHDNTFLDYWESTIKINGVSVHHYIFEYGDKKFHISFTKISIICSLITSWEKGKEKDIYKGYYWINCKKEIERYV